MYRVLRGVRFGSCAISLLLSIAAGFFWIHDRTAFEYYQIITTRHRLWTAGLHAEGLSLGRTNSWPEPPGYQYTGYLQAPGSRQLRLVGSMFVLAWGSRTSKSSFAGVVVNRGVLRVFVDGDGQVLRSPPWPGQNLATTPISRPMPHWDIVIPYWLIVVMTSLSPMWLIAGWLRQRISRWSRRRRWRCINCGYDLRASLDRCPECGGDIDLANRPTTPASPLLPAAMYHTRRLASASAPSLLALVRWIMHERRRLLLLTLGLAGISGAICASWLAIQKPPSPWLLGAGTFLLMLSAFMSHRALFPPSGKQPGIQSLARNEARL